MVFFWALLTFFAIGAADMYWRDRAGVARLAALFAVTFGAFAILAAIDNMKSELIDCRTVVDLNTGGDVRSCATDHWLPTGVWRVINRF